MPLLQHKPNLVQILLSYSDEHRKAMREAREIACQSLADLVRDEIENLGGTVDKVHVLGTVFADLLIEAIITDGEKLKLLETSMKKINESVGAKKVYIFAKPQ